MIAEGVGDVPGCDVLGIYSTSGGAGPWDCVHKLALPSRDTADIKFTRDG